MKFPTEDNRYYYFFELYNIMLQFNVMYFFQRYIVYFSMVSFMSYYMIPLLIKIDSFDLPPDKECSPNDRRGLNEALLL